MGLRKRHYNNFLPQSLVRRLAVRVVFDYIMSFKDAIVFLS